MHNMRQNGQKLSALWPKRDVSKSEDVAHWYRGYVFETGNMILYTFYERAKKKP